MLLQEFRNNYQDLMLQFLWRQWSALGVAGYGESDDNWVIDPEALLLFSLSIARFDQRLFDEILDWLEKNERFINVQRLRTILKTEGFISSNLISAIAGEIHKNKSGLKWKGLSDIQNIETKEQNLFYLKSGAPLPVVGEKDSHYHEYGFIRNPVKGRGLSKTFPSKKVPSLLLQIRSLFGINSRSEALLYLIINEKGTIQEIAQQTYYAWRSIQDVLFEMGHSCILSFPGAKKGRIYSLDSGPWLEIFLNDKNKNIQWICWPPLFRALEMIWEKINDSVFQESSPLEQSADIRVLMSEDILPRFVKAGFTSEFSDISGTWGENYLEQWLKSIKGILG